MLTRSYFEIKIAVLGNVSAGKTTLLNALFCDKYGEVSMKRTTAGINFFRVHTNVDDTNDTTTESDGETGTNWSNGPPKTRSAGSILKEISADNYNLRSDGYEHILEKVFDIALTKDLVPMRKDTKLVLVDIPGINEANTVIKYKDYVAETWMSFDGVIVVMDARQGVNTEDQVSLLKFVKEQLPKKNIPVIILCNKADDPGDEEQEELVKEARHEVENIFGSSCLETSLETVIKSVNDKTSTNHRSTTLMTPVFLAVSAIHAFIHQSASIMTREAFDNFDQDLLEKLGREQIGRRRWNVLSEQEKRNEAYKVVKEGYQDGLQDSNFDKLMKALEYCFGGESRQLGIINLQINISLQSLLKRPTISEGIALLVRGVHEKRKLLQVSSDAVSDRIANLDLVESFWDTYMSLEDEVFDKLEDDFAEGISRLAEPMNELISYHNVLTCFPDWNDEPDRVVGSMKKLVKRYVAHLLKMRMNEQGKEIKDLSSHDWIAIWGSVLLMSYSKVFCQTFGQEKIIIESLLHEANFKRLGHVNRKCPGCTQDLKSSSITIVKKVSETVHTCTPCMKCFATVENELRRCPWVLSRRSGPMTCARAVDKPAKH